MEAERLDSGRRPDEGRIDRGWRLTKVAWGLIRRDRTMLTLAFVGVFSATVFTALIFYFAGFFSQPGHPDARFALVSLLALYPSVLVSVFFNVALASAASAAFDDERMSVGEALRIAWGKRGRIAAWSLITAFIGLVISEIASRLPGGGRLVGWLAGAAWGLATIFVVPILAMESIGAVPALKRSSGMLRQRWGEGLTGTLAIGAWSVLVMVPVCILIGLGAATVRRHPETGIALLAVGLIALVAFSTLVSATRQVFAVALYRYAIDAPAGGFSLADLNDPFTPGKKRRRSWILRIGVPILALFVVLMIVVAIFHPRRHTAAEGYFHVFYSARQEPSFRAGTPVEYHRRRIGSIVGLTLEGEQVRVSFRVDPRFRYVVETHQAFAVGPGAAQHLCIGTRRDCHDLPPPIEGANSA